jgi:hypothetical protein
MALGLAQRNGRMAAIELLHVALLNGKGGGADEERDDGDGEPAVRSPPMILLL